MSKSILAILLESMYTGKVVSVQTLSFEIPILTAIEKVVDSRIVYLKPLTLHGYPVRQRQLDISEITLVKPYDINYDDSVYSHLREVRQNVREMKEKATSIWAAYFLDSAG